MGLEPWYVARHWNGESMLYTAQQWDPKAYKFRGRTFDNESVAKSYCDTANRLDKLKASDPVAYVREVWCGHEDLYQPVEG